VAKETAKACIHCNGSGQPGKKPRTGKMRRRGLCESCWRDVDIRIQYPARDRSGNPVSSVYEKPIRDRVSKGMPKTPTEALPGSEEKILVLMARAAAKLNLHHPDDRTFSME
jgi:hypothetical protein